MRLTVSGLKGMIRDELTKASLDEQRSASSHGGVSTHAGAFGSPDVTTPATGARDITSAQGQEDQQMSSAQQSDDPTDPSTQAQHKIDDETKQAQEDERSKAVGYP
jgi:hypothetical protein